MDKKELIEKMNVFIEIWSDTDNEICQARKKGLEDALELIKMLDESVKE